MKILLLQKTKRIIINNIIFTRLYHGVTKIHYYEYNITENTITKNHNFYEIISHMYENTLSQKLHYYDYTITEYSITNNHKINITHDLLIKKKKKTYHTILHVIKSNKNLSQYRNPLLLAICQ